jgi:hypothetical protein
LPQFHGFATEIAGNFLEYFGCCRQNTGKIQFICRVSGARMPFVQSDAVLAFDDLFLEIDVIRSLFRLLAYIALSLAIIAAVLDAARSVGASHLIMTSLRDSWQSISASSLALAETSIKTHIYSILWDPLMLWVLETPTFIVFALLAFVLYAIGYRRQNRVGRFAAR